MQLYQTSGDSLCPQSHTMGIHPFSCLSILPDYLGYEHMNRLTFGKLSQFSKAVNDNTTLKSTAGLPEEQQKHQRMSQGISCHTSNHLLAQCNLLQVYDFGVSSLLRGA